MYKIDDVGSLYITLPPNLQNTDNKCLTYAIDKQIKKFYPLAKKLLMWGDLDNLDSKFYDIAAVSLQALYYKSEYDDSQKLPLLKTALATYKFAGTIKAVEQLLSSTFGDAKFIPWYEYGGEPYHFKVSTNHMPSSDDKANFEKILKKVKAARSILDYVEVLENEMTSYLYIGTAATFEKEISIGGGD